MSESIRSFIAIELPPEVRNALADLIERVRGAGVRGVRLVRAEGIHLTLKFLGDVPAEQVEGIATAVSEAASAHGAFELRLGGAGAFPNRNSPRVLWVGLEGELEPLRSLHRSTEDALADLGFPRDKRAFNPHLTVARIRGGTYPRDRRSASRALVSGWSARGLGIAVDSVSLMRSILLPDGAVYERLASMPLSGESHKEAWLTSLSIHPER